MKTNATKRTVTLVLALILIVSAFPLSASAASSWPTLTSSSPCVMISPGQISVYRDSGLTTRGTCSPARCYNSHIDMGDDLRLLEVSSNSLSIKVDFPTSQGRKQGFVQTSTLLGVSEPSQVVTSKAKVTTYQYASTEKTYGAVYVGDTVYKCGTTKSGYVLVIYNVSGGYKAGFVLKSDWEKIVGDSQNASAVPQTMSYALYMSSGGTMTCAFDGYVNTNGRHEGIDFKRGIGSSVYSLTDGVITRVTEGYRGSSGLSTIAIYSASTGKTVIYLHSDPENSLYVGQHISRGQLIAHEDWRGCSSASGSHTHVEVREGEKTSAAKSVNDYKLDNSNPTAFWNSQGYQVQ